MPTKKNPKATTKKSPSATKRSRKAATKKPEDAIKSPEFQKAKSKAEEYARDPEKTKKLLDEATKKAKGRKKGPLAEVWNYLTALIRLVRAYMSREYTAVPWETIVLSIAAIIYFVMPVDLIPDFIPVAGLIDDAAIISFVIASIKTHLDDFLEWEAEQNQSEVEEGEQEDPEVTE